MSVLLIDRYQNATWKAISLQELKKVQLQERYTLVTHDSIGHLKTLCMSVLSLVVALESKWKCYSSSQSDKKMLAFEYEFSLSLLGLLHCIFFKRWLHNSLQNSWNIISHHHSRPRHRPRKVDLTLSKGGAFHYTICSIRSRSVKQLRVYYIFGEFYGICCINTPCMKPCLKYNIKQKLFYLPILVIINVHNKQENYIAIIKSSDLYLPSQVDQY